MDWGLAGSVTLSGLVLVFVVLVLLILLVELTSKIMLRGESKKDSAPTAPKPVVAPVVRVASAPSPVVQAGIDEETVAVISAAVYSCMDSAAMGTQYAISGIKRAAGERPVWGFAGMQQNTRPF